MGQAFGRAGDRDGLWDAYNRAYELVPDNPLVLGVIARSSSALGLYDRAIEYYERAEQIDPLGAIWPGNKADVLTKVERFDEAEMAYARALELNGNTESYNMGMADIYIFRGEFEKAAEALNEVPIVRQWVLRHAIAEYGIGNVEKSEELIELIKETHGPFAPTGLAAIYAIRGDVDTAMEWIVKNEAFPRGNLEFNPFYKNLYDDPRWLPYLESLDELFEARAANSSN
jgi:tetratricopeptide (TPR) repeat protein